MTGLEPYSFEDDFLGEWMVGHLWGCLDEAGTIKLETMIGPHTNGSSFDPFIEATYTLVSTSPYTWRRDDLLLENIEQVSADWEAFLLDELRQENNSDFFFYAREQHNWHIDQRFDIEPANFELLMDMFS
jgi:hypothetical protein